MLADGHCGLVAQSKHGRDGHVRPGSRSGVLQERVLPTTASVASVVVFENAGCIAEDDVSDAITVHGSVPRALSNLEKAS